MSENNNNITANLYEALSQFTLRNAPSAQPSTSPIITNPLNEYECKLLKEILSKAGFEISISLELKPPKGEWLWLYEYLPFPKTFIIMKKKTIL